MSGDWLRAYAGRAVVVIASGPSLTEDDCEAVRKSGLPAFVVNTTFRRCPWADVLVAHDSKWWQTYGAEVVITATNVAPDSPESYNGVADRLAREIPGAFRPDQFTNPNNPLAHYRSTGPEIWEDTEGRVGVLVAVVDADRSA